MSGADRISPTAHYTGYVWARNGLSHPQLATTEGRLMFGSLHPGMLLSRALGGATLEAYLLARHRAIDALLERAIEQLGVAQVIEVASGFSPRGWRFSQRYGERLTYLEGDLPEMAARKRAALARMGSGGERHRVVGLDALAERGPRSLGKAAEELDPQRGLAIITEGLLGYLPSADVLALWRRFARTLGAFPQGRYISDLHLGGVQGLQVRAFRVFLSAVVRGPVHLHFSHAAAAEAALHGAGFRSASVTAAARVIGADRDPGSRLARILEASTS